MKKLLLSLCLLFAALMPICAQEHENTEANKQKFGYISYNQVLQKMPELITAQASTEELRAKYEAEAKRAEDEFQRKFAEFLQGQKDFPPSIMQKRQLELQDLMDKSIAFRQESQRLMKQAKKEFEAPVVEKLNKAIQTVASQQDLLFVLNTDDNAVPFINPLAGIDITEAVLIHLGLAGQINK